MVSSTNDAVFQRRNNQIQDAIDAQNLRQALQLIEKRMKKGEDTRFLKVGAVAFYLAVVFSGCSFCRLCTYNRILRNEYQYFVHSR